MWKKVTQILTKYCYSISKYCKKIDTLSNQFSIKCLLLERKMKKSDNAKRGLSKIDNK